MIHRNTYINGPTVLRETWQTRTRDDLFFAGQISGVEGYVESAASGLIAGTQRRGARRSASRSAPPRTTALGALAYYVSHADPQTLPADRTSPSASSAARAGCRGSGCRRRQTARSAQASAIVRARAARIWPQWIDAVRPPKPTIDESTLDEFLEHLRLNENASAHTVRAYESDLSQFLAFLATHVGRRALGADADRPRSSAASARSSAICTSAATREASAARKLAALRTSAATCGAKGSSTAIPRRSSARRSASSGMPAHLAMAEMSTLLEMPDTSQSARPPRPAILELFYASGLRLSELVGLIWTT